MGLSDPRLSLMAFPQRWRPKGFLDLNVLVVPTGNPFLPLTPTGPAFAGTQLSLQAAVIFGLASSPPSPSDPAQLILLSTPLPANQVSLFNIFSLTYPISPVTHRRPLPPQVRVRKDLPPSYLAAAGIAAPSNGDTTVGDEFGCSLLGQDPGDTRRGTVPPGDTTWGALISFSLRQPRLARELGLLYPVSIPIDPATLAAGGWVYVTIPTGGNAPYAADLTSTPPLVRPYAARIPPLGASERPLFAAVLFPVLPSSAVADPTAYDEGDLEAQTYDDGFATVVHCGQPGTLDAATGSQSSTPPATEAGIQLGWDDEQVTSWHNRQLDIARARLAGSEPDAELPLGVLGYRVDVREQGGEDWASLCQAVFQLNLGNLQGPQPLEAAIEAVPMRANRVDDHNAWLPRYFAQWRGTSLVADDPVMHELTKGGIAPPPSSLRPVDTGVRLRYGHTYDFRVRLADLSGGGPTSGDDPAHPGAAAIAHWAFRRQVPPRSVRVTTDPPRPPMPPPRSQGGQVPPPPASRTITAIHVLRPLIGYPEMRFAGSGLSDADLDRFRQQVAQAHPAAPGDPAPVYGIPDPDVDTLHVLVEARSLTSDAGGTPPLDGPYRPVYEVDLAFPPPPADPLAEAPPLTLQLAYADVASISSMPPVQGLTLPIPTARTVRIRLTPVCTNHRTGYFATDAVRTGLTADLVTRQEATDESGLLVPVGAHGVEGIYLQPTGDPAGLLAQALDLDLSGLTLRGHPGSRAVLGASRFLRQVQAGDHSALILATRDQLLGHWIVAIRVDLARDWTWDGLADSGIAIERDDVGVIGSLALRPVAPAAALVAGDESQRRELTHLVFLDAVNPLPATGAFPHELHLRYRLLPALSGPAVAPELDLDELVLPVTTPPAQTPRLASAGIALSEYVAAPDYSSSQPRSRSLWLEFEEAPADGKDTYFARVLAYAPDPLLAPWTHTPDIAKEPPLSLPDEAIRVIAPGQSPDDSGLAAMTPLVHAVGADKRHFLLPPPPGIDAGSLLLFGLWTYELRVGHVNEWSTAHGRFGRPLRVAGVQHPAPSLVCSAGRVSGQAVTDFSGVVASAPLATPVLLDGTHLFYSDRPTRTLMFFLLYAQVLQADGSTYRNVLLLTRQGTVGDPLTGGGDALRDRRAKAPFSDGEIRQALAGLALPSNAPLSVLAVELLPSGVQPPTEPMTTQLGSQRILRTSPLTPVGAECPPDAAPLPKVPVHPGKQFQPGGPVDPGQGGG